MPTQSYPLYHPVPQILTGGVVPQETTAVPPAATFSGTFSGAAVVASNPSTALGVAPRSVKVDMVLIVAVNAVTVGGQLYFWLGTATSNSQIFLEKSVKKLPSLWVPEDDPDFGKELLLPPMLNLYLTQSLTTAQSPLHFYGWSSQSDV